MQEQRHRLSTSAIGAVLAAALSLVCSVVFFPLALVVAAVVLVLAVRALRSGAPDRRWYATATALAGVSVVLALLGVVLVTSQ